jgi:hypothetical protein
MIAMAMIAKASDGNDSDGNASDGNDSDGNASERKRRMLDPAQRGGTVVYLDCTCGTGNDSDGGEGKVLVLPCDCFIICTKPPCQHQQYHSPTLMKFVEYAPGRREFSGGTPEVIASKLNEIEIAVDHSPSLSFS